MPITRLAQRLHELGRSQRWLAREIGKDPAHINRLCKGHVGNDDLTNGTAQNIARILDSTVEDLFPVAPVGDEEAA